VGFVNVSMRRPGAVALGGRLQRAVSVAGLGQRMSLNVSRVQRASYAVVGLHIHI
jgi:hypothetical protein